MCGIAGLFDFTHGMRVDRRHVEAMLGAVAHRGPDGVAYFVTPSVGLAFTRLTILDAKDGMQPMATDDEAVVAICNGEIFNHDELRADLRNKGCRFRSRCDAEVLPYLYREYGPCMVNLIDGQFALAVFDHRERSLFLARDQFGICPLFYTIADGQLIFGSEIKALLRHPAVRREVDLVGLDQVLTFPGLISPRTMFRDIASLPPAHWLNVSASGDVRISKYWEQEFPTSAVEEGVPVERYVDELDDKLRRAVRKRLQGDVPAGVYLSGGLDSALIASAMRREQGGAPLASFSIDFDDPLLSERRYQRGCARVLQTEHRELRLSATCIAELLELVVYHAESPLNDTFNAATLALSALARDNGIRVVLAGEGADEMFAGYIGYRFDHFGHVRTASAEESRLRVRLWGDKSFCYDRDYTAFRDTKQALYSPRLREALSAIDSTQHFVIDAAPIRGASALQRRCYVDCKLRLCSHLLSDHGDRMAMAHGVEARYPYLDADVVAFAARLPPQLKLADGVEKFIVRQLGARYLPRPVADREKFAFTAPGSAAVLRVGGEHVLDLLSPATVRRHGLFDPVAIERLTDQYTAPGFRLNVPFESDLLITALTMGMFLETFAVADV